MHSVIRITTLVLLAATCSYENHASAQAPSVASDRSLQVMLIRNALAAVNHGNITGNYTVLRDWRPNVFASSTRPETWRPLSAA